MRHSRRGIQSSAAGEQPPAGLAIRPHPLPDCSIPVDTRRSGIPRRNGNPRRNANPKRNGVGSDDARLNGRVHTTTQDALRRAELPGVDAIHGIQMQGCFTMTQYLAINHFGISATGESWKAVEVGSVDFARWIPINPSEGLSGLGQPVGASGVRMVLDCQNQITATAGPYQVEGTKPSATPNVGRSATKTMSFLVNRAP